MNGFKKNRPCAHRELCATRIVINPWHDKTTFRLFPINDSHTNTSTSLSHGHDHATENANGGHGQNEPEEIIATSAQKRDSTATKSTTATELEAVTEEQRQEDSHDDNDSPSPPNSKFHAESRASTSSSFSRNTSSFATAYTNSSRTTSSYGATDENDDDIDYQVLRQPLPQLDDNAPASSTASIRTIRPAKKDEQNKFSRTRSMTDEDDIFDKETTSTITNSSNGSLSSSSKPSSRHLSALQQVQEEETEREVEEEEAEEEEEEEEGEQQQPATRNLESQKKPPLYWKSSGAVFMPPAAGPSFIARERRFMGEENDPQEKPAVLKTDVLLCKKSIGVHGVDNQPTRYKATRDAKGQKEEWKQLQAELTSTTLSLYSSSPLIWPCRRLEHQVVLRETHDQLNPHHYNTFRHYTKNLRLYLHSPLDYTFCVRYPYKQLRDEYITLTFRARTMTLSQEWYLALYRILPEQCKPVCSPWCEVNIPMLDLQVRLPLIKMNGSNASNHVELRYDISLESVKHAVFAVLEKSEIMKGSTQWRELEKDDFAMCWTRSNRTEWTYWMHSLLDKSRLINYVISPQHIEQTHRLELRQIEHTPSNIVFSDKKSMKEPHPVEGFLYRMTTFSGKPIPPGSLSRRRNYFASFNQYLFCISSIHSLKPPDEKCYEYPLADDSCIATVSPFTTKAMEDDHLSEHEIERRMHLMTEASRIIDLTEISHVQRSFSDDDDRGDNSNDNEDILELNSPSTEQLGQMARGNSVAASILRIQQEELQRSSTARQRQRNPILEIVMKNGLVIRLKADSSEACDAWVHHLANLTLYWRARKEAQRNIKAKHDYAYMFAEDFRYALTHQEKGSDFNKTPVVDTRIWSICCFEQCHDVVKTGLMYFQPRSRGTFSQKIFVLTANGWLLYYNIYDRATVTCQPIEAAVHDRKDSVDIAGCYVYSSPSPRRPARIFPDGIASADANDDSLFSLWKPQARRVFSPSRQRIQVYRHHRRIFQEDGETWQFLAKNRHEKEEWVWAFNVVIERLLRAEAQCF